MLSFSNPGDPEFRLRSFLKHLVSQSSLEQERPVRFGIGTGAASTSCASLLGVELDDFEI
jgi:hypothetical protein